MKAEWEKVRDEVLITTFGRMFMASVTKKWGSDLMMLVTLFGWGDTLAYYKCIHERRSFHAWCRSRWENRSPLTLLDRLVRHDRR